MKYIFALMLLLVAFVFFDSGWYMWPKQKDHPDDWLACAVIPAWLLVLSVALIVGAFWVVLR